MSSDKKVVADEKTGKHGSENMSSPISKHHAGSPSKSPEHKRPPFLVPSPVPTRRTRTTSQ